VDFLPNLFHSLVFFSTRFASDDIRYPGVSYGLLWEELAGMLLRRLLILSMVLMGLASGCSQFNTNLTTQTSSSSISFLSPAHVTVGAAATVLNVNGNGFVSGALVLWNGLQLPTAQTVFVSATLVQATIPASYFATPGNVQVSIQIPGSAVSGASSTTATTTTEVSNSMIFAIDPQPVPVPTVTSLSPSNIGAGSGAFTLTVTGANFVASTDPTQASVVNWNGAPLTTTVTNSTTATVQIPASDVASINQNPARVSVTTPLPATTPASIGGGTSAYLVFTITSAAPTASVKSATSVAGVDLQVSSAGTSADSRYVAFSMASTDGVTEQPGTTQNVFVRDSCAGVTSGCTPATSLISLGIDGNTGNGDSTSASISADGRYVAFVSAATNLVDSDSNGVADVFVRDTCAGAPQGCMPSTQLISVAADGTQANFASSSASISSTGRYVTFTSQATNLDPATSSGSSSFSGVFLRDTCAGAATGCTPSTHQMNLSN
jgi:trimeric autotransporter adhesin